MTAFWLDTEWIDRDPDIRPEVDQTYGRLGIKLGTVWLTAFKTDRGDHGDRIEVPSYPLAEWVAENWWALLYEPKKSDHAEDDPDFRFRHWFGSARDGFVLPDLWIYRDDDDAVKIRAESAEFRFARISLYNSALDQLKIKGVEKSLGHFIDSVISRLEARGVTSSNLHEAREAIISPDEAERRFCQLMGSMGLSPYVDHGEIETTLSKIVERFSDQVLTDLCEAAAEADFLIAARDLEESMDALSDQPAVDLTPLFNIGAVDDDWRAPAWSPGVEAAKRVRQYFEIDPLEPHGSHRLFENLHLDPVIDHDGKYDLDELALHGSLRREKTEIRMNLMQKRPIQRRFDVARTCFLAWQLGTNGNRLVTRARVRDQQASRAFAAELLAPADYIRSRVTNESMSNYLAAEIAEELDTSFSVVRNQASNNRIALVAV